MMFKSHLVVASAGFVSYVHYYNGGNWQFNWELAVGFLCVLVGACLPDIDHPSSTVGKRLTFISYPIRVIFGHRGITHSLISVAAILYLSIRFESIYISWIALGYLLHLAGDYLTDAGIPLLYPSRKRFRFLLVGSTNSASEYVMVGIVMLAVLFYVTNF